MFVTLCTLLGFAPYNYERRGPLAICFVVVVVVVVVVGGPMAKAYDVSSFMFSHVHSQSIPHLVIDLQFIVT